MKISVELFIMVVGLYIFIIANINARIAATVCGMNAEKAIAIVKKTARKNQSFHKFIFLNFIINNSNKVPMIIAIIHAKFRIKRQKKDIPDNANNLPISFTALFL